MNRLRVTAEKVGQGLVHLPTEDQPPTAAAGPPQQLIPRLQPRERGKTLQREIDELGFRSHAASGLKVDPQTVQLPCHERVST